MLKLRAKESLQQWVFPVVGRPFEVLRGGRGRVRGLKMPLTRSQFVALIPHARPTLEIGPFDRPKLQGAEVRYFDVLSQDGLRERAHTIDGFNPDTCPVIDYVSPTGDLSVVDRQFSSVFSSHAIEHQPDLIKHLSDVYDLLEPGGCYYLIVPDKRFCFDHFLQETQTEDLLAAEGRIYHTERAIEDHYLRKAHGMQLLHWLGFHGAPRTDAAGADAALARSRRGEYVDVHAWMFTPSSFHRCMSDLFRLGKIGLEVAAVYDTMFTKLEFMAILRRPGS